VFGGAAGSSVLGPARRAAGRRRRAPPVSCQRDRCRHERWRKRAQAAQVDGKSSLACYLMTLDRCYARLCAKYAQRAAAASPGPDAGAAPGATAAGAADAAAAARASARLASANRGAPARPPAEAPPGGGRGARRSPGPPPAPPAGQPGFSLAEVDFCVFHSPFNKLVRKAFARLWYVDHLRAARASTPAAAAAAAGPGGVSLAAACAAAAATAPARLGSEGASAAAELAGEEPAAAAGAGSGRGPAGAPSDARGPSGADAGCAAGGPPRGAAPGQHDAGQGCNGAAACAAAGHPCSQQRSACTGSAIRCGEGAAGAERGAAPHAPGSRPPGPYAPPGAAGGGAGPKPGRSPHPLDAFPADPDALLAGSYGDRALEAAALAASAAGYDALVAPGTGLALDVGNMYTGARRRGAYDALTLSGQGWGASTPSPAVHRSSAPPQASGRARAALCGGAASAQRAGGPRCRVAPQPAGIGPRAGLLGHGMQSLGRACRACADSRPLRGAAAGARCR